MAEPPAFAGRRRCRTLGGYDTRLLEIGEGPPVLLLHGSSVAVDAWLTWFRLIPILARNHRVLAYDQPGFGGSQMPADGVALGRLERAAHALALVEALDLEGLSVVGHSEGGFLATWLALRAPERIERLAIVASGATAPRLGGAADRAWRAAAERAYDYESRSRDEETFVATEGNLAGRPDTAFEALLRRNFRAARESGNLACMVARQRRAAEFGDYVALQEEHLFPDLPRLRQPCLLVWGGADPTVPPARGEALARLIPGSRLEVLPDAGHWVMHEAEEAFNRLIEDFLA